jgi:hypothetical protein
MAKTVRFSELVNNAGSPEIYLPLADPRRDRDFMRAVNSDRVLSLKQQPTGTRKDFGIVGFLQDRFVSYLVFSKSLANFKNCRVVGIKYDQVRQAALKAPRNAKRDRSIRPKPSPKPKPRPKRFDATVRLTKTSEVRVRVRAFDENEARRKAESEARNGHQQTAPEIETKVITLRTVEK